MRNFLIPAVVLICLCSASAQERTTIAQTVNNAYVISADTAVLRKALQRTSGDGVQISQLSIESVNAFHYLVGTGTMNGHSKLVAVQLEYDMRTRSFFAAPGLSHTTCSSAACDNCHTFKENGRIIGCKCEEKATISNQCNFTATAQSTFYQNIKRYIAMKK